MQRVIVVAGPTASGKSALAVELARHCGGEIVSADSMQIYREMSVGTAKPSAAEQGGVPHHLIGHVSVSACYSVAEYVKDARAVLAALEARGVTPVICGGTGLYIDHLLQNTDFFEIPVDLNLRQRLEALAPETLYEMLRQADPALAAALHPHDVKRVIRGLEVLETTGRPLSALQLESRRASPYRPLYIGLNFADRALLYERIDRRVDRMMEQGLAQEARALWMSGALSATARAAIGYKELIDALVRGEDLQPAVELVKQKTRNYAKRQITWFKRNAQMHWIYPDAPGADPVRQACALADAFLKGEES